MLLCSNNWMMERSPYPERRNRKRPPLNSPGEESTTCPICLDPIIDATEDTEGQEAIFCEGECDAWLHRQCAGLSQRLSKFTTIEMIFSTAPTVVSLHKSTKCKNSSPP